MADPVTAHDTISAEQLAATVELACRAPSLHECQPWRWVFDAGTLHLFADHARVGRHTDSTGREVILGCGAVLDHLEVAAAAAGWRVTVVRYPQPTRITTISRGPHFTRRSPWASANVCWAKRSHGGEQIGWRSRRPSRGASSNCPGRSSPHWSRLTSAICR